MKQPTKSTILAGIREYVKLWDSGEPIEVVEMGGLGEPYEQAIQTLTMEILRLHLKDNKVIDDFDEDEPEIWHEYADSVVDELNKEWHFSGAQVGAAKNQAGRFLKIGIGNALEEIREMDTDRIIEVSKVDRDSL